MNSNSPKQSHDLGKDEISIKQGRWSQEEKQIFLQGLEEYGKDWKAISKLLPSRTQKQLISHHQKLIRKQQRDAERIGYQPRQNWNDYDNRMTRHQEKLKKESEKQMDVVREQLEEKQQRKTKKINKNETNQDNQSNQDQKCKVNVLIPTISRRETVKNPFQLSSEAQELNFQNIRDLMFKQLQTNLTFSSTKNNK